MMELVYEVVRVTLHMYNTTGKFWIPLLKTPRHGRRAEALNTSVANAHVFVESFDQYGLVRCLRAFKSTSESLVVFLIVANCKMCTPKAFGHEQIFS